MIVLGFCSCQKELSKEVSTLVAMLSQGFQQSGCKLDAAALAYAKVGIGSNDAGTIGFIKKTRLILCGPLPISEM